MPKILTIVLTIIMMLGCKKENHASQKPSDSKLTTIIDSKLLFTINDFIKKGYTVCSEINFFNMKCEETINVENDLKKCYAFKNDKNKITLFEFTKYNTFPRTIHKTSSYLYEIINQEFTGDEAELSTYYIFYKENLIVVYKIEQSVFDKKVRYLSTITFFQENKITEYWQSIENATPMKSIHNSDTVFDEEKAISLFSKTHEVRKEIVTEKNSDFNYLMQQNYLKLSE